MTSTLYVYDADTREVAAIITGEQAACERTYVERFDVEQYLSTYTPAFGVDGGLVEGDRLVVSVAGWEEIEVAA